MKICMLGNFRVDYTSETHHKKSLESLGHTVIALQESVVSAKTVYEIAKETDLFIWIHTHDWETPGMIVVLGVLEEEGIPTVAYHLDLYMGIPDRWESYQNHDYFHVKHFFTPDKNFADWINKNRNNGYYLPAGVFHEECYIPENKPTYDLIFVGSRQYHQEWPYRAKLIDWLKDNYGEKFKHFGNDGMGVVRGAFLNGLYSSTKIVIGDSFSPNFDYPYFWSDRVYETTGRGGFIIHPYIKGLETQFNMMIDDKAPELITYPYNDFNRLKELIDIYLLRDEDREYMRKVGHERTKKEHTYKHRWQTILETIK